MDKKEFTQSEYSEIINQSIKSHVNLLPYVNTDNFQCLSDISDGIYTVVKYDITPEKYWNGNADDYKALINLLGVCYPSTHYLLLVAAQKIPGAVSEISANFYQEVNKMLWLKHQYRGYVALEPTPYMLMLHPTLEGKLFCYTEDILFNGARSNLGKPLFIVDDNSDYEALEAEMKKHVEKLVYGGKENV